MNHIRAISSSIRVSNSECPLTHTDTNWKQKPSSFQPNGLESVGELYFLQGGLQALESAKYSAQEREPADAKSLRRKSFGHQSRAHVEERLQRSTSWTSRLPNPSFKTLLHGSHSRLTQNAPNAFGRWPYVMSLLTINIPLDLVKPAKRIAPFRNALVALGF